MKQYSVFHKAISIILSLSLVLSFVGILTVSTAAEGIAGSYTWRIRVTVDDNFDSTSDSSDRSYLTIKGSETNGTEGEAFLVEEKKIEKNIITDYSDDTTVYLTNVLSGGDIGASKDVVSYTTSAFPTYFYMQLYKKGHGGLGNAGFTTYLDVKNSSGSWINLCSDSAWKNGGWGEMHNSASCPAGKKPYAGSLRFTKNPASTLTVPKTGELAATTEFDAKVYDQYGVVWYVEPTYSLSDFRSGISVSGKTLNVSSEGNSADGADSTVQLNATYQTLIASTSINIINATYTYAFEDQDGKQISSGSLKYGQVIPKPDDPIMDFDDTYHYKFTGWAPAMTRITGDAVFKPVFEKAQHVFLSYKSDKNATCTQDGTKTATCTCGKTHSVADPGSALGHSYTHAVTKQPGCTENGIITYTCIRGDHSYETEIEPTGHKYTPSIVAPGCSEQGYTLYTCSVCGDSYRENFTDALGHSWNSGVVTKAAACTESGEMLYTCERCEETKTEEIAPLGHNLKNWTIRSYPSCTKNGEKFSVCTRCKETVTQSTPAYGHSWSEWEESVAATCEAEGTLTRTCMICSAEEHQVTQPLGHDMVLKTTTPEDGKQGMFYYACSRNCGKYASCEIDEDNIKHIGEVCEQAQLEELTTDIPTASFNTYNRKEVNYNYVNRGASLRIDEKSTDTQSMRFSASMLLPKDVEIVDFGYIYTRSDYFKSLKKFVLGGNNVASTSVKNGKYSTFQTAQGEVKTFNVVIQVKQENWNYDFIARPYIIYHFAGETFTVYDEMYASRSVDYIAARIMESPLETQYVKDYIQSKIIDR